MSVYEIVETIRSVIEPLIRADEREQNRKVEREYMVQISRADAIKLSAFATNANGSMNLGNRLTVEAVENGGLLIRTKPVGYYSR
jgi:hypothetical protein